MEKAKKEKLNEMISKRKNAHARLTQMNWELYRSFFDKEKIIFGDGILSKKNKELIAIAVGLTTNCESCMQWHIKQAINEGATELELIDVIEVVMKIGLGPANINAKFALEVIENIFES